MVKTVLCLQFLKLMLR